MTVKASVKRQHFVRVQSLDNELYELAGNINILDAVSPQNFWEQKNAFFDSHFRNSPAFSYCPHKVDVFKLKRCLYNLRIEELVDDDLIKLYSDTVQSYADKIDQFSSVGSDDFVYDSLRYYGEPSEKDIRNARFIMHLPDQIDSPAPEMVGADSLVATLESFAKAQGYEYQIKRDEKLIANALVSGTTVKINPSVQVSKDEMLALAHHELGVHLVTTLNARLQPLKILSLGCPLNTCTQEGLAILCEYLAGYMTLPRLKILALRVLAVQSMLAERDFKRTFLLLKEQYAVKEGLAFTITARVYRGGGLTKDYLYLQGLHQMLNAYEHSEKFSYLLCGKVSLEYLEPITRLIEKEYLVEPKYISPAIVQPGVSDDVQRYIVHAIK